MKPRPDLSNWSSPVEDGENELCGNGSSFPLVERKWRYCRFEESIFTFTLEFETDSLNSWFYMVGTGLGGIPLREMLKIWR